MGFLQSIVSFLGLISMISITFLLNMDLFEETDVTQPMGSLCNVNSTGFLSPDSTAYDTRGLLYGPVSVSGCSFYAGVGAFVSFIIAALVTNIDMNMSSKYEKGSIILGGDPMSYVAGILYRLSTIATALLMFMTTILIVPSLQVHANALNLVEDSVAPESCNGLGLNEFERLDRLQAMFIASSTAVVMVIVFAFSVKYDRKASSQ
jgi:hypothetical protein